METSPAPWIAALRRSHDALHALTEPLTAAELEQRSYAKEWSIAQVLSHLGSGAEVFNLFLDAGLSGQDPPGQETFPPIWDAWNALGPQEQAFDSLAANEVLVGRFETLDAGPARALPACAVRDGTRLDRAGADAPERACDP